MAQCGIVYKNTQFLGHCAYCRGMIIIPLMLILDETGQYHPVLFLYLPLYLYIRLEYIEHTSDVSTVH